MMVGMKQLLVLLVVRLFSTVAVAQGASPLPASEVSAILSIRQKWQGSQAVVSWVGQDPCAQWNGVICYQDPATSLTNIVSLNFANANLNGSIPPEIGNITRLNSLFLTNNQFSGPIPLELSRLFYLEKMLLNNNQLTGGIPAEFALLSRLTILNVDNNRLTEPLPPEIFSITALRQLSAQSNQLSGGIPGQLLASSNLNSLNLRNNRLNGPIPDLLGNMTTLQSIDLSGNGLTGPIPTSLGNLKALTFLSLADNQLTGPIPVSLANLSSLQSLWLNNNQLEGSIPRELQFIADFRAYGNRLTGLSPASAPGQIEQAAPPAPCSPGTSISCTCPAIGTGLAASGMQYCSSNGSVYGACICQPQQCRTCPLGQTARPAAAGASCPPGCYTPLVLLIRIVNLTMADFDNVTSIRFRTTLAQQLQLDSDQVALLQIAPGSVIATVGFLPAVSSNATSLDPLISSRIATALLSQTVNLGEAFTPYQTLTVLPAALAPPGAAAAAAAPVVVKVTQTSWPWVVSLLVLSVAVLIAVCGVVAWCLLTGRCAPRAHLGPSPPHSRRFQPLLTNDPDPLALGGRPKSAQRALPDRQPMLPHAEPPPSTSNSRHRLLEARPFDEPRTGPVSRAQRLADREGEAHTWSPRGVNESARWLTTGAAVGSKDELRRSSDKVVFDVPLRKVHVQTTFPEPQSPVGRQTPERAEAASIALTQLGGQIPGPALVNQPGTQPAMTSPGSAVLSSVGARELPLAVLRTATDNFSEANWVGTGGFGLVYRGVLPVWQCPEKVRGRRPTQDIEVAVKVLDVDNTLSDHRFKTQMELLGRLKHKYLVELIGYCMEGHVRMLVYEFMAFGSLADHLHGPRPGQPQFHQLVELTWRQRMRIAYGAARGLNYLHTPESVPGMSPLISPFPTSSRKPPVVHRDLSTSNILLDDNMQVRVGDFGLAPLMLTSASEAGDSAIKRRERADTEEPATPSNAVTPVSRGALGPSPGARSGPTSPGPDTPTSPSASWTSPKSDVFAFGIVLLELVTGSPPLDETRPESQQHIIAWAKPHLTNRETMMEIVDPKLGNRAPLVELYQVAAVISMCIQPEESARPPMSTVVQMLAPLSEAPDPEDPSESGRPDSSRSESSGTGTGTATETEGGIDSGSFHSGGGRKGPGMSPPRAPFSRPAGGSIVRPLMVPRPAGYREFVTPGNTEGLHPVHWSPDLKGTDRPTSIWNVRLPEYHIPEEVLEDLAHARDERNGKAAWRGSTTRPGSASSSESSGSVRTESSTPDSVLPRPWSRKDGKGGSHRGRRTYTLHGPLSKLLDPAASVSNHFAPGSNPDVIETVSLLVRVPEEDDRWAGSEMDGRFVDEPREDRTVGTPSIARLDGGDSPRRRRRDDSPGKRKRASDSGSDARGQRVRSKSQGS